jgi:hypothetical protein
MRSDLTDDDRRFAERLLACRTISGLSRQRLADAAKLSEATIKLIPLPAALWKMSRLREPKRDFPQAMPLFLQILRQPARRAPIVIYSRAQKILHAIPSVMRRFERS